MQWIVRACAGENITSASKDGWQPVHHAAYRGHIELIKWIYVQRSRHPQVSIEAPSAAGWRPVHVAACAGQLDVVRWLANRGVDIGAETGEGWTVLHAAAHGGSAAVVSWLVERGARVRAKAKDGREPLHVAAIAGNGAAAAWLVAKLSPTGTVDGLPMPLLSTFTRAEREKLAQLTDESPSAAAAECAPPPRALQTLRIARRSFTIGAATALISAAPSTRESMIQCGADTEKRARAATRVQCAARRAQAARACRVRATMCRLTALMSHIEHRNVCIIQRRYRAHHACLREHGATGPIQAAEIRGIATPPPPMAAPVGVASPQGARAIQHSLDQQQVAAAPHPRARRPPTSPRAPDPRLHHPPVAQQTDQLRRPMEKP